MLLHNIKIKCKEKGLSVAALEREIGVAEKSIFKWDESMPSADKLVRAAQVLGTTAEELLKE